MIAMVGDSPIYRMKADKPYWDNSDVALTSTPAFYNVQPLSHDI